MSTSVPDRIAAALLAIEGLALLWVTGRELVALVSGDSTDTGSSIALMVLTVVGVVAVIAFAIAVLRGQSWGRSGGIVTQLLILAVAIGALTGPAPSPGFALALAVPALVALVALFAGVRRAGAARHGAPGDEA
ncbi:histidine kinase [Microbacterium sp. bgisy203]|uniref:histidine kinase n=1 Tax=Microbacterium sp. bgisy203 TaxID=3413799 RepID=UPI003D745912